MTREQYYAGAQAKQDAQYHAEKAEGACQCCGQPGAIICDRSQLTGVEGVTVRNVSGFKGMVLLCNCCAGKYASNVSSKVTMAELVAGAMKRAASTGNRTGSIMNGVIEYR